MKEKLSSKTSIKRKNSQTIRFFVIHFIISFQKIDYWKTLRKLNVKFKILKQTRREVVKGKLRNSMTCGEFNNFFTSFAVIFFDFISFFIWFTFCDLLKFHANHSFRFSCYKSRLVSTQMNKNVKVVENETNNESPVFPLTADNRSFYLSSYFIHQLAHYKFIESNRFQKLWAFFNGKK